MGRQSWEQTIQIQASAVLVDRCLSELPLIHRWLGAAWEPIGTWDLAVGSGSRQLVSVGGWQIKLSRIVLIREPGLVVWGLSGFLTGREYWECQPNEHGTLLIHRWELQFSSVSGWGWSTWLGQRIQEARSEHLQQLKFLAEELYHHSGQ